MKAKQLFYLLLALPLLAVACNEEPEVKPTPATPELNITSATTVDFTADGGNGEIAYELKNAVEGTQLTAEADATWITDVTVAEKVTYFVEANETEEAREATVTLTYGSIVKSVAVKQAAKANEKPEPDLEASIWSLVGTHNGWDPAAGVTMYVIEGYFVAYGFELTTASEFKFVQNGAWGGDLGGNGAPAEANCFYPTGGTNIKVAADGKYDIYLNEATDTFYVMEEGKLPEEATEPTKPVEDKWELVGDFEGSNWGGTEFAKEGDTLVLQDVKFANANNEGCVFKVRNNGAWYGVSATEPFEVNAAIVMDGESNAKVNAEVGVAYDFYFDAATMTVWVMEDGKTPGENPEPEPETIDLTFETATVTDYNYENSYIEVKFEGATDNMVAYFNTDEKVIEGGDWNIDNSFDGNTVAAFKTTVNGKSVKEDSGKLVIIRNSETYNVSGTFAIGDDNYTVSFNGNIVLPDGTNMGAPEAEVISDFTEVRVNNVYDGGKEWEILFCQNDMNKNMHILDFTLPEAAENYVPSGTYSVADGTLSSQYSIYRYGNTTDESNIAVAQITVTINEDDKTATFNGSFTTASGVSAKIDWTGVVTGFNFNTEKVDYYTEWSSVSGAYWAKTESILNMTSADGSLSFSFDIIHTSDANKYLPEGTYNVEPFSSWTGDYVNDTSKMTLNNNEQELTSGSITVTHVSGGYKIVFDITDKLGRNAKGEYEGAIGGNATNPQ